MGLHAPHWETLSVRPAPPPSQNWGEGTAFNGLWICIRGCPKNRSKRASRQGASPRAGVRTPAGCPRVPSPLTCSRSSLLFDRGGNGSPERGCCLPRLTQHGRGWAGVRSLKLVPIQTQSLHCPRAQAARLAPNQHVPCLHRGARDTKILAHPYPPGLPSSSTQRPGTFPKATTVVCLEPLGLS